MFLLQIVIKNIDSIDTVSVFTHTSQSSSGGAKERSVLKGAN